MNVLTDESYKSYSRLSRYSSFPIYYHRKDNKYIYGITTHLSDKNTFTLHKVRYGDTFDSLALEYYNNPTYYWVILDFNKFQDPFMELLPGMYIKIPTFSSISFND